MSEQNTVNLPAETPEQPAPSSADLRRQAREAKAMKKANRSWPRRHKVLTGMGVAGAIVIGCVIVTSGGDDEAVADQPVAAAEAEPAAQADNADATTAKDGKAAATEAKDEAPEQDATVKTPSETPAQANARESAEMYLDTSGMSQSGLVKQLEFEGYSKADATYAVDAVDADWNAEALESAQDYLDTSGFSESGLVKQLEFEGFTADQAQQAADGSGADWNAEAAESAQDYVDTMSFSHSGLVDQLTFDGYTADQAEHGADAVGL